MSHWFSYARKKQNIDFDRGFPWISQFFFVKKKHIDFQERTLSGPHFSMFLGMQCFCYIMFDHLCSYTCDGIARDPRRLSDFLRGWQRMSRES